MTDSRWRDHGVRVVRAGTLDPNTAQTPGMHREAAMSAPAGTAPATAIPPSTAPVDRVRTDRRCTAATSTPCDAAARTSGSALTRRT